MKPPFSPTFNLQFSIFPFFIFIFQKEQNLTRSSSLEIKKSFSLLRWFHALFVQKKGTVTTKNVSYFS